MQNEKSSRLRMKMRKDKNGHLIRLVHSMNMVLVSLIESLVELADEVSFDSIREVSDVAPVSLKKLVESAV